MKVGIFLILGNGEMRSPFDTPEFIVESMKIIICYLVIETMALAIKMIKQSRWRHGFVLALVAPFIRKFE